MTIQLDRKSLANFIRKEHETIMDMLITYNVPETIEDDNLDAYLLPSKKNAKLNGASQNQIANDAEELEERLKTIKNKMRTKKNPISEQKQKRRDAKKLKKNKEVKKIMVSQAKAIKNESQKRLTNGSSDPSESKKDIKPVVAKPVFNQEGKMVFSKFDFASHPGAKVKKSHQNPREILTKIKQTDKKLKQLKEQGELEKVAEIKTDLAWKKAFDKIEGKKVKDDPKLLHKAIKKRKDEKKKAKKNWVDRKKKVETDISKRQKKRQENIEKRIKDNKNTKLKKMAKKGRVIPGF